MTSFTSTRQRRGCSGALPRRGSARGSCTPPTASRSWGTFPPSDRGRNLDRAGARAAHRCDPLRLRLGAPASHRQRHRTAGAAHPHLQRGGALPGAGRGRRAAGRLARRGADRGCDLGAAAPEAPGRVDRCDAEDSLRAARRPRGDRRQRPRTTRPRRAGGGVGAGSRRPLPNDPLRGFVLAIPGRARRIRPALGVGGLSDRSARGACLRGASGRNRCGRHRGGGCAGDRDPGAAEESRCSREGGSSSCCRTESGASGWRWRLEGDTETTSSSKGWSSAPSSCTRTWSAARRSRVSDAT